MSMMINRRSFLEKTALAGLGASLALKCGSAKAGATWPPYSDTLAIDAASSVWLVDVEGEDELVAAQLAAMQASGLTAVGQILAPSGRFWLNDEAFERTKSTLDKWDVAATTHSDRIVLVRSGADL